MKHAYLLCCIILSLGVLQASGACSESSLCSTCTSNNTCVWCTTNSACVDSSSLPSSCSAYKQGSCDVADSTTTQITQSENGITIIAKDSNGDQLTTGGDIIIAVAKQQQGTLYPVRASASSFFAGYPPSKATGAPDAPICEDTTKAWCNSHSGGLDWLAVYFSSSVLSTDRIVLGLYQPLGGGVVTEVVLMATTSGGLNTTYPVSFDDSDSECPEGEPLLNYQPVESQVGQSTDEPVLVYGANITLHDPSDWVEIDTVALTGSTSNFLRVVDNHDGTYFVNVPNLVSTNISIFINNFVVEFVYDVLQDVICMESAENCDTCLVNTSCVWCSSTSNCVLPGRACTSYKETCSVADPAHTTVSVSGSTISVTAKDAAGNLILGDFVHAEYLGDAIVQYAISASASDTDYYSDTDDVLGAPDSLYCDHDNVAWYTDSMSNILSWLSVSFASPVVPYVVQLFNPQERPSKAYRVMLTANGTSIQSLSASIAAMPCTDDPLPSSWFLGESQLSEIATTSAITISMHNYMPTTTTVNMMDAVSLVGSPISRMLAVDNHDGTYTIDTNSLPRAVHAVRVTLNDQQVSTLTIDTIGTLGCETATELYAGVPFTGDFSSATNPTAAALQCDSLGAMLPTVWYYFIGNGSEVEVSTCGASYQTQMAVYSSTLATPGSASCAALSCVVQSSSNDGCACSTTRLGSSVSLATTLNTVYYIAVQTIPADEYTTAFDIVLTEVEIFSAPPNNVCASAMDITFDAVTREVNNRTSTLSGASAATVDICGVPTVFEGSLLWFKAMGRGNDQAIRLDLCSYLPTSPFVNVYVFEGGCDSLCDAMRTNTTLVSTNYECGDDRTGLTVVFDSVYGTEYHILVQGTNCGETEETLFTIETKPAGECSSGSKLYYNGFLLDPVVDKDYSSYCDWVSLPGWEDKIITLSFDPSSSMAREEGFIVQNQCSAVLYCFTDEEWFSKNITVYNGYLISSKYSDTAVTTYVHVEEPVNGIKMPPTGQWGDFYVPGGGCIVDLEEDYSFVGTNEVMDNLFVIQYYWSHSEFFFTTTIYDLVNQTIELVRVSDNAGGIDQLPRDSGADVDFSFWDGFEYQVHKNYMYLYGGRVETKYYGISQRRFRMLDGADSFYRIDIFGERTLAKLSFTPGSVSSGRAGHSLVSYQDYLIAFAGYTMDVTVGYTAQKSINDMTIIDFTTSPPTSSLHKFTYGPSPRAYHSSIVYGDIMYVFGGRDVTTISPTQYYFAELWAFHVPTKRWTLTGNYTGNEGPEKRMQATMTLYKGNIIMIGGYNPDNGWLEEMWSYNISGNTWEAIHPEGNPIPTSLYGTATVVGGQLFMAGRNADFSALSYSTIGVFQYSIDVNCNIDMPNIGECNRCPLGTKTRDSFLGGVCATCPLGTFGNFSTTCNACPEGTYGDLVQQSTCKLCPEGFFGNATGRTSLTDCAPCPFGTYNGDNGSMGCESCPEGKFCPLGSTQAIENNFHSEILSSEQHFKEHDDNKYASAPNTYMWVFFGFFCLWLIIVVVSFILRKYQKAYFEKIPQVDILNVIKYEIPGPVLKAATVPGGMISILAALMICALFVYVVLTYVYNRNMIVRGIGAGFSTTDFYAGHLQINLDLHGYPGGCVVDDMCDPGITVANQGFLNRGDIVCKYDNSTCEITWTSPPNNRLETTSFVQFAIFASPSSVYAMGWNVSVNSVYDNQDSYVTGYLLPENQTTVFRGPRSNAQSVVAFSLIPTLLTVHDDPEKERRGLTLDFLSRFPGPQTDASGYAGGVGNDAFNSQGVLIEFKFEVPQFVYQKQVIERMTTISYISNFIALVGGILGIARAVLMFLWTAGRVKHRIKEEKRKSRMVKMELERV